MSIFIFISLLDGVTAKRLPQFCDLLRSTDIRIIIGKDVVYRSTVLSCRPFQRLYWVFSVSQCKHAVCPSSYICPSYKSFSDTTMLSPSFCFSEIMFNICSRTYVSSIPLRSIVTVFHGRRKFGVVVLHCLPSRNRRSVCTDIVIGPSKEKHSRRGQGTTSAS